MKLRSWPWRDYQWTDGLLILFVIVLALLFVVAAGL